MLRPTLAVLLATTSIAGAESVFDPTSAQPLVPLAEDSAIVGGTLAPAGKWPDTVAVIGQQGVCTGTLIAPDVVLTAGHCADIRPQRIVANTTNYAQGGVSVNVTRTTAYPNWETTYDVAVLVLAGAVQGVTPRKVGTTCTFTGFTNNTSVHVVGFGATDTQAQTNNSRLYEVTVPVTDPGCTGGNGCNPGVAPGGEFKAGGGGIDSCNGDSGGPVYLDTPRGPIVVGAVSRALANAQVPCGGGGIYVRTDKLVQWLETSSQRPIAKDDCAAPPPPPDDDNSGQGTGSGSGSGSGSPTGEQDPYEPVDYGDVTGGCSAGGGSQLGGGALGVLAGFALGWLSPALRRRRRAAP
jgi:secreted trypsin-like serine protease